MIHELKTWPKWFTQILLGVKQFEFRKDDRGFGVGDTLRLEEWNNETGQYTGRSIVAVVTTTIRTGDFIQIPAGYCISRRKFYKGEMK